MLVPRRHDSGLILAEHGSNEHSVRSQLRALDPDLILTVETNERHRCFEYVVVKTRGDQEAVEICRWRDHAGRPLPLSSGILEHVNRLRADARTPYGDPAEHNERLTEQIRRAMEDASIDAAREIENRRGRIPAFHRSRQLYLTRARARSRGETV